LICELSSSSSFQITLGVHERKKKEEQIASEIEKVLDSSPSISCRHCSWRCAVFRDQDLRSDRRKAADKKKKKEGPEPAAAT
jgi:Fe-S-cluster-containing dehydrogenase component